MSAGWIDSADRLTRLSHIVDALADITSAVLALVQDESDCESPCQALSDARGRLSTAEQELQQHAFAFERAAKQMAEDADERGRG